MVRWIETAGILFFLLLVSRAYGELFSGEMQISLLAGFLALPIGFYIADFATGMIHWIGDSFGSVQTPLWGPYFVAPFRRHHDDMSEITRLSLAENLGNSSFIGILALLVFPVDLPQNASFGHLWAAHLWLFAVFFAVAANLFHRWAHLPPTRLNQMIRFLHKKKLLLSSQEHLKHHVRPYRRNYCVLCGWANPLVNRIPLKKVESFLSKWGLSTQVE